jgi:hypothetical protein
MHITGIALFNFLPDGTIVLDGDHAPAVGEGIQGPFDSLGISLAHADVGDYRISGPGLTWPDGWKVTIFKNENDENTVRVTLGTADGGLRIQCVDPDTREPKDVVYMMTVRLGLDGEVNFEPLPTPQLEEPGYEVSLAAPADGTDQADS